MYPSTSPNKKQRTSKDITSSPEYPRKVCVQVFRIIVNMCTWCPVVEFVLFVVVLHLHVFLFSSHQIHVTQWFFYFLSFDFLSNLYCTPACICIAHLHAYALHTCMHMFCCCISPDTKPTSTKAYSKDPTGSNSSCARSLSLSNSRNTQSFSSDTVYREIQVQYSDTVF